MVLVGYRAGIFSLQNAANAFLHLLIGLPVSTRSKRVSLLTVFLVTRRIPFPAAYPLYQSGAYSVAFNRQGMIGVQNVRFRDPLHIGIGVLGQSGGWGERFHRRFSHRLPHEANAIEVGRSFAR